jgi:hypothetical protein
LLSDPYFRIRSLFRKAKVEEELDHQLRFHLGQKAEKFVRAGMSNEGALRRVRLEFGGLDQVKEQCRDARGITLGTTLVQTDRTVDTHHQKQQIRPKTLGHAHRSLWSS